jgi:endonuclease/exonuclease/phosphatase family metal-dependent hydrolase
VGNDDHYPPSTENTNKTTPNQTYIEGSLRTKKQVLHVGTYNVRSLVTPSRQIELENALTNIHWDILGLSEVKKSGKHIVHNDEYIMLHKGNISGRNGVGFMVKNYLKDNITDFIGISDRVARLDLQFAKNEAYNIIQVYAPTEKYTEDAIQIFYSEVRKAMSNAKGNILLIGDFNAKIGSPTAEDRYTMGPWGYGQRNSRGETLIEFCLENQFSIMNTYFKKNQKRRWTWSSPDFKTKNEIDFIIARNTITIEDIQIINTSHPTDHRLVRAKLILNCEKKKSRTSYKHKTTDLTPIEQESIKNIFAEKTKNFQMQTVQESYKELVNNIRYSYNKLPSKQTTKTRDIVITPEVTNLIAEREWLKGKKNKTRGDKKQLSKLYWNIGNKIKKNLKNYQMKIIEEELRQRGSAKRADKRLNTTKTWIVSLKKSHDCNTTSREAIVNIATEFFKNLYSSHNEQANHNHNITDSNQDDDIPALLECEVQYAIRSLKNNKSPGEDAITNDILKAITEPLVPILTNIFNNIIRTLHIPEEWEVSIITLIYKKGDPLDIGNYRPISLLPTIYKVFTRTLLTRISPTIEYNQPKEQAGFRSKYSTIDHIFTLTQVMEKYIEYKKELFIAYVDYSKAFDSISHKALWNALISQGVNRKYVDILQVLYSESKAVVRLERRGSSFDILRGVRQGDPISPKLFTALLEEIFRKLDWTTMGLRINGEYLSHLRFADDIVVLSENHQDLEVMLKNLEVESQKCGLLMNTSKTCVMTNGEHRPVKINQGVLTYVDEYIYLGQSISFQGRTMFEVERRIKKAWNKYWALKHIFKSKLPLKLKKKVFDNAILPVILYGCQTWAFTKEIINKLKVFQKSLERSMLGLRLRDRVRSSRIRHKTKLKCVAEEACRIKWRWAGHVARSQDGRWSERVLHWWPREDKRSRGRPRRRWCDDIIQMAGPTWPRLAADRTGWHMMEEAFVQQWATQQT